MQKLRRCNAIYANKNVNGRVYRSLQVGSFILRMSISVLFLHHTEEKNKSDRQRVTGRIIDVKEMTVHYITSSRKEDGMEDDAAVIYAYMEYDGAMPVLDKSHPEKKDLKFKRKRPFFFLTKKMKGFLKGPFCPFLKPPPAQLVSWWKKKRFSQKKVGLT